MWKLPNGKVIKNPKGFTIGNVNYPMQVFRRWTKEELNAIGVFPYREVSYDQRFYTSTGTTETEVDGEIVREHTLANRYTNQELRNVFIKLMKHHVLRLWKSAKEEQEYLQTFDEGNSVDIQTWATYKNDLKQSVASMKTAVANISSYEEGIEFVRTGAWAMLPEVPFQEEGIPQ